MTGMLTRRALYDLVWSKPRTTLAREMGVSDVWIGKQRRALNVPAPPPGYWASLAAGGKPKAKYLRPPLTYAVAERMLEDHAGPAAGLNGFDARDLAQPLTVANLPRRYMWDLRNVPAKRPQPPAAPVTPVVNAPNNTGTIVLQTGAGATAHVQQQWMNGDTSELRAALVALREALERAPDVKPEARRELIADVDSAAEELQQERPNKGRLLRWLGGIGGVVGAIGSVQPAYEAVKALARVLGLPL